MFAQHFEDVKCVQTAGSKWPGNFSQGFLFLKYDPTLESSILQSPSIYSGFYLMGGLSGYEWMERGES